MQRLKKTFGMMIVKQSISTSLFFVSLLLVSGCTQTATPRDIPAKPEATVEITPVPTEATPKSKDKSTPPLIVIDPGHGGEDFGALGADGLKEKEYVLDIANRLAPLLEKELHVRTAMTRHDDTFIALSERTKIANDKKAALFISLHANASPGKRKASGFETFYLDNSGDEASKLLAQRENASISLEGAEGDLDFILSDLIQNGKLDDSITLAHLIQKSVSTSLQKEWTDLKNLGVKRAPFYVLVGAHMPCVLVEMYFIDSKTDSEKIRNEKFREKLVIALKDGVAEFLKRQGSL